MTDAFSLTALRGRNGWDDPVTGPDSLAMEMLNLDPYGTKFGKKRHGVSSISTTGISLMIDGADGWADSTVNLSNGQLNYIDIGQGRTLNNITAALFCCTPAYSYAVWGDNGIQSVHALTYSTSDGDANQMMAMSMNAKVFIAGNSGDNRLGMQLNPLETFPASTNPYRVWIKAPLVMTVANTGAGAYPATLRYYRLAYTYQNGLGTTIRRSNLGATGTFTPSGAGAAVRVTIPATPSGEPITHWELYASLDNVNYYLVATTAIGTTTYDDSTTTTNYVNGALAPREGENTPFPSVKYLLNAFNRLMGFGRWETSAGDSVLTQDGRVYFSPPRGSNLLDVEESIRNCTDEKGWVSLSENATGRDTALCGPLYGSAYAFQDTGIYQLVPTGVTQAPFRAVEVTRQFGAVSNQSTFLAEDESGQPAIYFLDPQDGPRRIGANGIEWLGMDVADIWATVNKGATARVAHGIYVAARKQVWFWLATGSANRPNKMIVLDLTNVFRDEMGRLRGGWHVWDGYLAGDADAGTVGCSSAAMCGPVANQNGAPTPYVLIESASLFPQGSPTVPEHIGRVGFSGLGAETGTDGFSAYFTTKAYDNFGRNQRVSNVQLMADAMTAGTIEAKVIGNTAEGATVNITDSVSIAPVGTETQVLRRAAGIDLSQVWSYQLQVGDVSAVQNDGSQFRVLNVIMGRQTQDRR